jgi:protocatechuate 3,4-dioxygenase beta subunit
MPDMKARKGWLVAIVLVALGAIWWIWQSGRVEVADASAEDRHAATLRAPPGTSSRHRLDRDVRREAKATIMGKVSGSDHEPIGGARVCAMTNANELDTLAKRQPVCTIADPKGHYALEGLFAVSYRVSASAPRYKPAQWTDSEIATSRRSEIRLAAGQTIEGIDIVLEGGGVAVRGVVKDLSGGPIPGAWVWSGDGRWGQGNSWGAVTSDDEGAFELWVAPGNVRVTAVADGYTQGNKNGVAPGQTFEVFLTPASTLVGKVVMAGGTDPVANARVTAAKSGSFGERAVAFSGPDGVFRIEGIEPGTYKAEASTTELFGMAVDAVHLGLAETSEAVLVEVHPAFAVEGSVVISGTNEPCPAGRVRLESNEGRGDASAVLEHEGTAVLRALQPGTYKVHATCEGYAPRDTHDDIEITDASVRGLVWEVDAGSSLRGVVVHADGTPVEGVRAFARPVVGDNPRAQRSFAWGEKTEADGRFEIVGLLPGKYELDVSGTRGLQIASKPEVEVDEKQDQDDLRLELQASGTLEGVVRDAQGQPVGGATVAARDGRRMWISTTTLDDGSFRFEQLTVGSVRVHAQTDAWQTMRAPGQSDDDVPGERVTVAQGETTHVNLTVESRDGVIRGRVVDADGGPISDAFVDAERESDSATTTDGSAKRRLAWGSWSRKPVLTDMDGNFELEQLAEGTYVLKAYRQGGGEGVLEGVALGSDVTVSLESPGTLEGTIVVEGSSPPERFTINLTDRRAGIHVVDTFFRTQGAWRMTNVAEGRYEVLAQSSDGDGEVEIELASGETKSDIEIALTGRVTVRGKVVDLETGEPIPGMRVDIGRRSGSINISFGVGEDEGTTDHDGRYVLERVPIGPARAIVLPRSFGAGDYDFSFHSVTVPSGATEVTLPPLELVKKRLADGEAGGSLGLKLKEGDPAEEAEDRRMLVGFVRPGGPAAQAGLETGDEILSVDGRDVTGANSTRFHSLTAAPPGTVVTLGLADDRKVAVTLGPPE